MKDYETILTELSNPDTAVRRKAVLKCIHLADPFFNEPLLEAIQDNDSQVRVNATAFFCDFPVNQACKPLIEALHDEEEQVRRNGVEALGKTGDLRAVAPLLEILHDKSADVRHQALKSLAILPSQQAILPLINILKDGTPEERLTAEQALLAIKEKELVAQKIIEEIHHEGLRESAARCLGQLGGKNSIKTLINLLADKKHSVQREAVKALKHIGDISTLEPLVQAIKTVGAEVFPVCDLFIDQLKDKALARSLTTQAENHLIALLQNGDEYDCSLAARFLSQRKVVRAVPFIGPLLLTTNLPDQFDKSSCFHADFLDTICASLLHFSGDLIVQHLIAGLAEEEGCWSIIQALNTLNTVDVTELLLMAYPNAHTALQEGIVLALAECGDHRARAVLRQSLKDRNHKHQQSVIRALGRLHDQQAVPVLLDMLPELPPHELPDVIETLGLLGDTRAVQPLLDLFHTFLARNDQDAPSSLHWILLPAIEALGKLGDPKAFSPLIRATQEREDILFPALEALKGIHDKETVESLLIALENTPMFTATQAQPAINNVTPEHYTFVQLLRSRDQATRSQTAKSLIEILHSAATPSIEPRYKKMQQRSSELLFNLTENPNSVEYLILALRDNDTSERLQAVKTIYALKAVGPELITPLQEALTDESKLVRTYAEKILRKISACY